MAPGAVVAAVGDTGGAATLNVTGWPEEFSKPIWSLPYSVSSCTWSGMLARNRTVTLPLETWERSAYSLPVIEMLLLAKLSLPSIRNLPSVEIITVIWPLNSACEV